MVKLSKEQIQSLLGTLTGTALKLQVENLLKFGIQDEIAGKSKPALSDTTQKIKGTLSLNRPRSKRFWYSTNPFLSQNKHFIRVQSPL